MYRSSILVHGCCLYNIVVCYTIGHILEIRFLASSYTSLLESLHSICSPFCFYLPHTVGNAARTWQYCKQEPSRMLEMKLLWPTIQPQVSTPMYYEPSLLSASPGLHRCGSNRVHNTTFVSIKDRQDTYLTGNESNGSENLWITNWLDQSYVLTFPIQWHDLNTWPYGTYSGRAMWFMRVGALSWDRDVDLNA